MAGVYDLRVVEAPVPDQHVVDLLESMLVRARAGELKFCGVIATTQDDCVVDGWCCPPGTPRYLVLGAFEAMKHEFIRRLID